MSFAGLASRLAASPLGVEATFTPAAGGPAQTIRVVPTRPEAAFGGFEGPRTIAPAVTVMIPTAALATRPVRNDQVAWGDLVFIVMEVAQDARSASWTCALRRA